MTLKRFWPAPIILLVLGAIAYGVAQYREKNRWDTSRRNLKSIGAALRQYHKEYECFPPAYVLGDDGKPWHSWRVLLLPYLGEEELYARYRFDEPWNGPHNQELQRFRPKAYASPFGVKTIPAVTTYLGVVGRRTMWPAHISIRCKDVRDGTSNTAHVFENCFSDVIWSEPREMSERQVKAILGEVDNQGLKEKKTDFILVAFADSSVRRISAKIWPQIFATLLTPSFDSLVVGNDRWPPGLFVEKSECSPHFANLTTYSHPTQTRVVPTLDAEIEPNLNTLYSATLQIGWDKLRPTPESSVVVDNPSMVSELLNANPFSLEAMKNSDYVATAYASNLEPPDSDKNFLKASDLPDSDFYGRDAPSGLRILSTIKRAFPLPERLTRFSDPLKFPADADGMRVESFGLRSGKGSLVVLPQSIELRDYVSDDDFIVSLFSVTKPGTEIVLAKVVPERTLRKTWDIVNDRLNTSREQNRQLGENIAQYHRSPCSGDSPKGPTYWDMRWRQTDELQIPVLSIGIVAAIPELIGTALPTTQQPDRAIVDVRIAVRLSIDDCGSESIPEPQPPPVNDCGGDLDSPKVNPRRMIYDKPFLLAIREWNAESPYFLGWIANAELMQAAR